jgi:hypothetical protein
MKRGALSDDDAPRIWAEWAAMRAAAHRGRITDAKLQKWETAKLNKIKDALTTPDDLRAWARRVLEDKYGYISFQAERLQRVIAEPGRGDRKWLEHGWPSLGPKDKP